MAETLADGIADVSVPLADPIHIKSLEYCNVPKTFALATKFERQLILEIKADEPCCEPMVTNLKHLRRKQLFNGTDNMEELDVSGCLVDEACLDELLRCFTKIRSLRVANCEMVSPNGLRAQLEHLR